MSTNKETLNQLREAIDDVHDQRKLFQHSLTQEIIASHEFSDEQLAKITKMKLNHSKVEILSIVNDAANCRIKRSQNRLLFLRAWFRATSSN
ncbi:hypothetical protein [Secundilactobacillus collinoides]|uniref:hypothetical protein n=1 Tax=Secundilactobacillus collinoides TaxID=33960 RepID=UPI0006D203BE|nr:hypothetical protein [Secundilactobacillus collinoides]